MCCIVTRVVLLVLHSLSPRPEATDSPAVLLLSPSGRVRLSSLLDSPSLPGQNDWRALLAGMGLDRRHSAYFSSRRSPSEALLLLWEARAATAPAQQVRGQVLDLVGLLSAIGRDDCAQILESDCHRLWQQM